MKSFLSVLLACFFSVYAYGSVSVKGRVKNNAGNYLRGVSMALLYPEDSTLAAFGMTNKEGYYDIAGIKPGHYLLQAASAGYYTEYLPVNVGGNETVLVNDMTMTVNEKTVNLGEVVVSGEKVPIKMLGDTVEYNAGSFKVKPNAPVEELLKQLPGVQVDASGNIKSMGKDVSKVLVDGKEFFGNDPKVATKNLPADAVSKVQTFGKKSDQAEFTGIDDGERDQTINLVLKDGKRKGYFGDVYGGYGTNERYEAGLKAFRFDTKTQVAAIGLLNNINNFGFTFSDYITFNGGLGGLMNGGNGFSMNMNSDFINFGQPVEGNITSGALGLNYTFEPKKGNRFNISYMGNGTDKDLISETNSVNFLPDETYNRQVHAVRNSNDIANRMSIKWRNELDSFNQLTINARGQIKNNNLTSRSQSRTLTAAALENSLADNTSARGFTTDATGDLGFVHKTKGKWQLAQAKLEAGYSATRNKQRWSNQTEFYEPPASIYNSQYQNDDNSKLVTKATLSATRSLGNATYLTPSISAGYNKEQLNRDQGLIPGDGLSIDSLSPHFFNDIYTIFPGMALKKSTTKRQWHIGLQAEFLNMRPTVTGQPATTKTYSYLLPNVNWRRDLGGHKSLELRYQTMVNTPATNQLLPVTYYTSPLSGITGNIHLKPEYKHDGNINYNHFDEFTMSSLFTYLNASYTANKINAAQTIDPLFRQQTRWVNTAYEARFNLHGSYDRPIRKWKLNAGVHFTETVSLSVTPINGVDNKTTSYTHEIGITAGNRNNKVWGIQTELSMQITDAYYSISRERNNTFYNYTGTGSLSFQSPNTKWYAQLSADITHYTARSFDQPVTVPLLRAELSRFVLANNRGTITLKGFDLLNMNKSIYRTSQVNYLAEQRSNIISQYFMLTFNYKLSKTGKGMSIGF
ncbi:MAG TPA: outer membrane beta-barrel protein [Flavipsychrobacter sp.]|nr:outer membrane beta-barrel protein [Flavipsychrobacter sp.]